MTLLDEQPLALTPCGTRPGLFYDVDGEDVEARERREAAAKALCMSCEIMSACRDRARLAREHGVWGAETDAERALLGYGPPDSPSPVVQEAVRFYELVNGPKIPHLTGPQWRALEVLADGPAAGSSRTIPSRQTISEQAARILANTGLIELVPLEARQRTPHLRWRITPRGAALLTEREGVPA